MTAGLDPNRLTGTTSGPDDLVRRAREDGLAAILRRSAARYPDKTALIAGETRWTYRELDALVNELAVALLDLGLAPGQRLAIVSRNSWQWVVLAYAAARAGIVLVPINFMLGPEEIAFILTHSDARAVVAEGRLVQRVDDACRVAGLTPAARLFAGPAATDVDDRWVDVESLLTDGRDEGPSVDVDPGAAIRLMYTSGTESRPKGVMLTSSALISQYVSAIIDGGMSHTDVDVHALPFYHCAQLDCHLGPDIYLGATSVVLDGPNPTDVLGAIEKHGATRFFAPPTVWISLLRHDAFDDHDLSSLRDAYYGASAMPVEVLRELATRLPGLRMWNFYGQTELAPVAAILGPDDHQGRVGAAGRPVLNVETRIVDDEGSPVGAGVIGEIVHRSPQATVGYWQDPDATAAAFRGGWFHSGDLGVMSADGYVTVVDRKKDIINTGGENVASREVEEAIYLHPDVHEVAVFGVPDPKWVEAVAAVVVAKDGAGLTPESIHEHCARNLAGFKRPKLVLIARELPKNPSGKILKRKLREIYASASIQPT